tara:strand:+ start:1510 stop:2526 length:1017 start_codon:yes stop_codon:yes gene_type:complete
MLSGIKSTPAKILLGISALVSLVYSVNFMFWADCYVTGGADCLTLISNETILGDLSYGKGGPETSFNGTLMFGIFISSMIILNEGPKGMWKIMVPVMIGLSVMTAVIWLYWDNQIDASSTPKYVVPVTLALYVGSYFMLKEEGVDDGMSDFTIGVKIKDKIALLCLGTLAIMGIFYCFRAILFPDDTVDSYEIGTVSSEMLNLGLGSPSAVTVAVGGSLFLVYLLWILITIMDGAKGKWAIIHPGLFFTLAVVMNNYTYWASNIGEASRPVSDQFVMDSATGPLAMLLLLISYYRLRDEGVEEGMTIYGEDCPPNKFNVFLLTMALGLGLLFTLNAFS